MRKLNLKLAITASAGAVAASQTQAAVFASPTVGSGLKPPAGLDSGINWDVDNDGQTEFRLEHGFSYWLDWHWAELAAQGYMGHKVQLVMPNVAGTDGILKLGSGFAVGPTLTGAKWGINGGEPTMTMNGAIGFHANQGGWAVGDTGYFGFRFTDPYPNEANMHYGWGEMTITGTPEGQGFTINKAYYESTPGASIAVPEPASLGALGLVALAMGALARRTRNAAA